MECDPQTDAGQGMDELVADLHRLLDGQLAAGREGDFPRAEQLGKQANGVVAGIVRRGAITETQRHALEQSYGELILVLRAHQADVQGRLRQLRQVKRAVGAYRIDH